MVSCTRTDGSGQKIPVTIAGYVDGESDVCKGYYIIRGNWGPDWGEYGNGKICIYKDKHEKDNPLGACSINEQITYIVNDI